MLSGYLLAGDKGPFLSLNVLFRLIEENPFLYSKDFSGGGQIKKYGKKRYLKNQAPKRSLSTI